MEAFVDTDRLYLEKDDAGGSKDDGCTAVAAILVGQRLVVANVGDSRAVLCRAGQGQSPGASKVPQAEGGLSTVTSDSPCKHAVSICSCPCMLCCCPVEAFCCYKAAPRVCSFGISLAKTAVRAAQIYECLWVYRVLNFVLRCLYHPAEGCCSFQAAALSKASCLHSHHSHFCWPALEGREH